MADIFDFYVYDDRSIQFVLAEPIMLEDKDVTQFRFRIPKSLNGFDMSGWEWWFIFVNPNGTKYTTLLELTDDEDEPEEYSVATYTVGYGFSGIVGTVKFSIEALNVSGEEIINEWHTKTYATAVIDTLQGLRAIIPEPDGQVSTGITEEVKQALLQIARKVAYIDEHGQTYYNALYDALYAIIAVTVSPSSISLSAIGQTSQLTAQTTPAGGTITWSSSNTNVATVDQNGLVTSVAWGSATITATSGGKSSTCSVLVAEATLTEISAVYTPSGTVYESDSLDSLKSNLVVTAHWSNGTTTTLTDSDYTLSGTLATGTSTITASFGGQADTFDVTVVGLVSITATYTQSGTVYDTDSLDDLKSDLVVTANYSDGTSATVTDYTLSGTLAEGTSVVTVSYGGKTGTFNVVVTHDSMQVIHDWDFTQSLTDSVGGVTATLAHNNSKSDPTRDANGLDFNNWGQCVNLGAVYDRGINIDIFMSDVSIVTYNGHCRLLMYGNDNGTGTGLLIFRNSGTKGWSSYTGSWGSTFGNLTDRYALDTTGEIKLTMKIGTDGAFSLYVDDQYIGTSSATAPEKSSTNTNLYIGNTGSDTSGANFYNAKIKRVRIYQEV